MKTPIAIISIDKIINTFIILLLSFSISGFANSDEEKNSDVPAWERKLSKLEKNK